MGAAFKFYPNLRQNRLQSQAARHFWHYCQARRFGCFKKNKTNVQITVDYIQTI